MQQRIFSLLFVLLFSIPNLSLAGDETTVEEVKASHARLDAEAQKLIFSSGAHINGGTQAKITAAVNKCKSASTLAENACIGFLSPHIQTASGVIGSLLGLVKQAKLSTSEACEKYNSALDTAEKALALYNGACAAAQWNCSSSCKALITTTKTASAVLPMKIGEPMAQTVENNNHAIDTKKLSEAIPVFTNQEGLCQGYTMNMMSAGTTLLGMVRQSGMASTCKDSTTTVDCKKTPTDPSCPQATKLDCSKSENYNTTDCICDRTPNAPGCPGAIAGLRGGGPSFNGTTNPGATDSIKAPSLTSTRTESDLSPVSPTGSGSGGGSAAGGGSGGGAGGLGGSGSNAKGAAAADGKAKGLNPNILSGYDGGGGGGGGRGGGRVDPNSPYNAYLPGGAKDPSRGLASKTFGNGEVTSAGSKSNWEKVRERYQDNRTSLMGP